VSEAARHQPPASEERARVSFGSALLAFLALPGVVALAVPVAWLLVSERSLARPWGLALLAAGGLALLWCVRDFYVAGRGTLAPWAPPSRLVVVGLYRYSRNPMYVAVCLMLLGWALSFASWGLLAYAVGVAVAFHLRVVLGEEPWLARRHGVQWQRYVRHVPRWLGRPTGGRREEGSDPGAGA
jgi:protein-S-isoprenylcysteine O-methyltransferase Ste14